MSISLFSAVILVLFAIIAAIEIYRGVTRGLERTLVSLGSAVVSTVVALVLAPELSKPTVQTVANSVIAPSLNESSMQGYGTYFYFVSAFVGAIISSLFFVLLFFAFRALLAIILHVIRKKKLLPNPSDPGFYKANRSFCYRNSSLLGGIAGGLCAVLVAMAVTAPLMGTLHVAETAKKMVEKANPHVWENSDISYEELSSFHDCVTDLPGNLLYELGGKYMYQAAAKANVYGISAYLVTEMETVEVLCDDFLSIYSILRTPQNVTGMHLEQLARMEESVFRLNLFRGVLGEYVSDCAASWLNDETFLNIPKPYVHPSVEPIFDKILYRCLWSDSTSVHYHLSTLLRVYAILLKSGIAWIDSEDYSGLIACLEENDLIERIDAELQKNPYLAGDSTSDIALQLLCNRIESFPHTSQEYDMLVEHLASSIDTVISRGYSSQEEMIAVLSTNIQSHTSSFGISIQDAMAEATAKAFLRAFEGYYDVTSSQVENLLKSFSYERQVPLG